MHNEHIGSESIRNSQFFSMSERKKQYNIITAHHLANHTSDQPCIYCTKTDGIGNTPKSPCVHTIGINTYHLSQAPKEVLPRRVKWKKGNAPKVRRADIPSADGAEIG